MTVKFRVLTLTWICRFLPHDQAHQLSVATVLPITIPLQDQLQATKMISQRIYLLHPNLIMFLSCQTGAVGYIQWNRQTVQAPDPLEKTVLLFQGNFIIDCPVPYRLLRQVPHSTAPLRDEFSHMRYSAVTCDPADFYEERFTLRPPLFARPRTTEIMIIVTMYNKDDILFARTLRGVLANVKYLTST